MLRTALPRFVLPLALAASSALANAAPSQIETVYDLYRNGLKLGQVIDRMTVDKQRYTLTSESRVSGALRILWSGTVRLESTGDISPAGLRPIRFTSRRSDKPRNDALATFDWNSRSVSFSYRGETRSETGLTAGAQDQLSQVYQFAYMKSLPDKLAFQLVNGRETLDYRYLARPGESFDTPLGKLATRHYERVGQRANEKRVDVWIAPAKYNLPVRVIVVDDEGVTMEQQLVSARVKD